MISPSSDRNHLRSPRAAFFVALALLVTGLGACDFDVVNPGPTQDAALDDPAAHGPLVTGMSQALSGALWRVGLVGAEVAREYVQGGRIFTTKLPTTPGQLTRDDVASAHWNTAQEARWVAEDGIRRFRESESLDFGSSALAAQALVHAGYANRLLGENFCEAVFDGGPALPGRTWFERAEAHLTEAVAVAESAGDARLALAARVGRATVRVHLGDWDGAEADASGVPEGFVYQARFTNSELNQYNIIYWSNANSPFRTHSVIGTFYEDYYRSTGDPRVAWGSDPEVPTAEIATVPWLFQLKYQSREDPINLTTGREARLILAEAALRRDDAETALDILNALRTSVTSDLDGQPLEPWPDTSDPAEVWARLKTERGIELWLEGRRLGDLRRWVADGSPAEAADVSDRVRLCFPIAQTELEANPNLNLQHPDPVNPAYVSG
ncbi:MAG: RagB/SusD family nutrient uptake outer membrane protein [Gemmatimonadota bacterium]